MNIGFDAKRAFFNFSGLGNYSRNIITALQSFYPENQYFLFTPPTDGTTFPEGKSQMITPTGVASCFPSLWRSFFMGRAIRKHDISVFHGLSNELPADALQGECKLVVTIHDTIFKRYPEWYKWHDRLVYERKTAFSCQVADTVIATSEQTKADLIRFFNVKEEKIEVVYQPCHPIFTIASSPEEKARIAEKLSLPKEYLLMVGNIEPRKNILNVIKAIQYHAIDLPLVIIGRNNAYAESLKEYVKNHQLASVHFYDSIENKHLSAIYQMARMLLYPSFFEGFGIPIIEALSSRIPVITSHTSCLKETGGDAALYVDPATIDSIADAILKLSTDDTLRQELIKQGEMQMKKFDIRNIAGQLIEIYQR